MCDFNNSLEFYYNKLKNNGVITKKFNKNSIVSNCLRITIPKINGVKYILQLLKHRDLLIIAFENTLFNVKNSYIEALLKTFEHFAGSKITYEDIRKIVCSMGGNYFEAIQKLLLNNNININMKDITDTFKNIFYNPEIENENYLINYDELIIPKEITEKLSLYYNLAIISSEKEEDIMYSLKKHGMEKYFTIIETDITKFPELLKKSSYKNAKLLVSSDEILYQGKKSNLESIVLITPDNNKNSAINNFKHVGCDDFIFENDILEYFKIPE